MVATSPIGDLKAKDVAAWGLSSGLSLSNCGYKSDTFWLYLYSVNSVLIVWSADNA